MHVRCALAWLSFVACTPATPPVERATPVAEAAPVQPAEAEPARAPAQPEVEPAPPSPPSEPAPTAPVVSAEPLVPAKRYPETVYGVVADKSKWVVDIVDFDYAEGGAIARAFEGGDERIVDDIAAGSPLMPLGWAIGDDWTLVTRAGTVPKKAESFAAYISEGSGVLHFEVRLGPVPRGASGPAVAIRGRTGKHAPVLAKPAKVELAVLGDDALAKITAAIDTKLDPEQRESLGKHPLAAKHVEVVEGQFPGERTHAIIVRMVPRGDDPAVSGILFAKADGRIELSTLSDVWGQIELFALGDLDGDGTDELVYEDAYHEGWYLQLLHWKHGKPAIRVLTGDGV